MEETKSLTCCCGPFSTRVETGARLIAMFGVLLNLIVAFGCFLPGNFRPAIALYHFLGAVLYASIIVAQDKRNHKLYMPYLIFEGIGLFVTGLVTLVVFYAMVTFPQWMVEQAREEHPEWKITDKELHSFLSAAFLISVLTLSLNAWFYSIIYRAYKSLKQDTMEILKLAVPIV